MINNKIRVAILGCCASREMFNYTNKFEVRATVYSSIISLFENKINASMDDCKTVADSFFQARNTYFDFNKLTFQYLNEVNSRADYLIIDFAETVSDYYFVHVQENGIEYETKITANQYVKNLLLKLGYKFDKMSSRDIDINQIVQKLFESIFSIYPKERVILNKVSFSKFYQDSNYGIFRFEQHYRMEPRNLDKVRAFESEAAKYVLPENILESFDYCLSDKQHKYGCSPLHYMDDDYYYLAHRFENFFGLIADKELYNSYSNLYQNNRLAIQKNNVGNNTTDLC